MWCIVLRKNYCEGYDPRVNLVCLFVCFFPSCFFIFRHKFDDADKNPETKWVPDRSVPLLHARVHNTEHWGSHILQPCTANIARYMFSTFISAELFLLHDLLLVQKCLFGGVCLFVCFLDNFHVLPLKFTKHLDMYNPDIAEWREDIGRVVTRLLAKVLF